MTSFNLLLKVIAVVTGERWVWKVKSIINTVSGGKSVEWFRSGKSNSGAGDMTRWIESPPFTHGDLSFNPQKHKVQAQLCPLIISAVGEWVVTEMSLALELAARPSSQICGFRFQ